MGELVRTLLLAGLISGTQPLTIMALLLVMAGERPRRTGWAFIAGAFTIQAVILLVAGAVIGATVSPPSAPGRVLIGVRIALGVALIVFGLLLRRPPKKDPPEVPKILERLRQMTAPQAYVAGIALADYQGPVIASLALVSAEVSLAGRLGALAFYSVLASGIPIVIMLVTARSRAAHERVAGATNWVMHNRRLLASWVFMLLGLLLVGDGLVSWAAVTR